LNGDYEQSHSLNQELVYLRGLFTQVTSISQAEKLIDDVRLRDFFKWIDYDPQSMDFKETFTVNELTKEVSGKTLQTSCNSDPIELVNLVKQGDKVARFKTSVA